MRFPSFGRTHVKVALLSAALIAIMLGIVGVSLQGVATMRAQIRQGLGRQYQAQDRLLQTERQYLLGQLALVNAAESVDPIQQQQAADLFTQYVQKGNQESRELAKLAQGYAEEQEALQRFEAARDNWLSACEQELRQIQEGKPRPDLATGLAITQVRFASAMVPLDHLHESVYEPAIDSASQQLVQQATTIRTGILIAFGIGLAVSLFITRAVIRAIRAQHADLDERTRQREEERQKKEFESRVQRGMDMAQEEAHALSIVGQAVQEVAPGVTAEVLLADSSHAHLLQVLTTDRQHRGPGCPVTSPNECPAVRRGAELAFETNQRFDVCPYLKDRPHGPCSAVCVPVSIMGQTVGVMHAIGADHEPLAAETVRRLALIAGKSGERIGVIRAFAKSQAQASRDSLTGLLNRRSLEHAVSMLNQSRRGFTVAYGDIDHFKRLNDTHGHETGDRALRIFADVIHSSVRPTDVVSRWGGEEFVVLLPQASADQAAEVLERVRTRLAERLADGSVPPFTVSFGVCDASVSANFDERLKAADDALMRAKSAGRNRIVVVPGTSRAHVADEPTNDVAPTPPDELVDVPQPCESTEARAETGAVTAKV